MITKDKMPTLSKKKVIGWLIIPIILFVIISYYGIRVFTAYHRNPELNIKDLLNSQILSIPENWSVNKEEIWKDSDFTNARWAYVVRLNNNGQLYPISEEIHVFTNPILAKIFRYPSPTSIFTGNSYFPAGWKFRPTNADYFDISCSDDGKYVDITRICLVIIRYSEYTVVIRTPINTLMTYGDLEKYLEITDQYMNKFIVSSKLISGPNYVPISFGETN